MGGRRKHGFYYEQTKNSRVGHLSLITSKGREGKGTNREVWAEKPATQKGKKSGLGSVPLHTHTHTYYTQASDKKRKNAELQRRG